MQAAAKPSSPSLGTWHGKVGLALLVVGELLIFLRVRPPSDYYFPFVWVGFTLLLDDATYRQTGFSLYTRRRLLFFSMFPVSAGFWWLFELFNQAVHNWIYVGTEPYSGIGYVAFASLDFSTVLPAVWSAAFFVHAFLPPPRAIDRRTRPVPLTILTGTVLLGVSSAALSIWSPTYFFGLIWVCMFFVLDPINCRLGRPSILSDLWNRRWRSTASMALGALLCGVYWEAWNFWSLPKWIYHIPHVGFWHVFEMPVMGYSGYLPFGLELFAMTNFVVPRLGLGTLPVDEQSERTEAAEESPLPDVPSLTVCSARESRRARPSPSAGRR